MELLSCGMCTEVRVAVDCMNFKKKKKIRAILKLSVESYYEFTLILFFHAL